MDDEDETGEIDRNPAWVALGEAVVQRRVELGMRTRRELIERSGISRKTLGQIERGDRESYDRGTLAHLEQVLRWPAGAVQQIVSGREPAARALPLDDPDPLPVKLERLALFARGLTPADLHQLGVNVHTLIEWAATRTGTPEVPGDLADFQRATAAADRAAVEHAQRQPVPPMSRGRRPAEARTDG